MKNVNIAPQQEEYDAIVVGSGISGGWAAKELTEKGLKTLVLERGRHVEHGADYVTEHVSPWEMPLHGYGKRRQWAKDYPIQSKAGPVNAYNKHWFVKDSEHPYGFDDDQPFYWIRGYHLGGRSICWGRHTPRRCDYGFEENARDGFGNDWPIRYKDIAPWYDYVERYIGVSGQNEGLETLPDGQFLPPMAMNCAEHTMKEGIERAFPDRTMTIGRCAVLTQNHKGRAACHYCGPCSRGCSTGSYFSSLSATLPAAQQTGNLTIRCDSIVHRVEFNPETGKASGVRVIDRESGEEMAFNARVIFLCASALGSTKILLQSTSSRFPNGLANASGALGHYLMDHPFNAGATGTVPGHQDKYYYGNRPNGVYITRFQNVPSDTKQRDFLRGYCFFGGAGRQSWGRGLNSPGVGATLKKRLHDPGPWTFSVDGFGEMLPRKENYCELDPEQTDQWGLPLLRVHCAWSDNERNMRKDMAVSAAEMLEAAGATNVEPYLQEESPPGLCIHEMGTARMGRDPQTSVLNRWNQAHDVPNLFITDGAAMCSTAWKDPSITYMALTARAADYAVQEMKRGNL